MKELWSWLTPRHYSTDEALAGPGVPGEGLQLLLSGRASAYDGAGARLYRFSPGDAIWPPYAYFAFDNQGAVLGAQSVACAVHDRTGAAVAGLSIATPVARMSRDRFARLVRDGAREMSRRLGLQDPVRV